MQKGLSLFSETEEEVILTIGSFSTIEMMFLEIHKQNRKLTVIIADSGPDYEGRDLV